uniref:Uncharacterized protein n=1 Tax=Plectus sambesii TaxID=2011161 RepID=A0A914XFK8_9BILA
MYVKNHLDEPTVRMLMITSNARKSSLEIAALGGIVTQQLTKNYIIALLLESTRWKDTNYTRLATERNYPSVVEYAEAMEIFNLVNRPYEEDSTETDLSGAADDDCQDGDCYLNEEDYILDAEGEDGEDDLALDESAKMSGSKRPMEATKQDLQATMRPPAQRKATAASLASTTATPSSWIVEWHVKDKPTAKAMVSSGTRWCLNTLTVIGGLITLTLFVSL